MHAERYHVSSETVERVRATRAAGGRVVAVGTTVVRTLESVVAEDGEVRAGEGSTELFITSPERRVADVRRELRERHIRHVPVVNAEGRNGDVRLTILAIPRKRQNEVLEAIKTLNPSAFVTVDDVSANTVQLMKSSRMRK